MREGFKIHQCPGPTPDQLVQNFCVWPGLHWAEGIEDVVSLGKAGDIQVAPRCFPRSLQGPVCGLSVLSREQRGGKPDLCYRGQSWFSITLPGPVSPLWRFRCCLSQTCRCWPWKIPGRWFLPTKWSQNDWLVLRTFKPSLTTPFSLSS